MRGIHDDNGIRWITLDRPEIRNALRVEDLDHIADGVRSAGHNVQAIILTGAGDRAFSAGMHVRTFADATPESARTSITRVRDCLGAIRLSPRPTLALINGYCIGAGFEMALACDLRIAHPEVQFGLPEVKLGIPSVVDAALLQQFVGLSKAKEIILTGKPFSAQEALDWGVVNKLCAPDQLMAETIATAQAIANNAPIATRQAKRSIHYGEQMDLRSALFFEIDVYNKMVSTEDRLEGVRAFNEKRKPSFKGR